MELFVPEQFEKAIDAFYKHIELKSFESPTEEVDITEEGEDEYTIPEVGRPVEEVMEETCKKFGNHLGSSSYLERPGLADRTFST